MDNRQSIINKIAKMSKLTENSGAFEGEASNAASMIQTLMEKYAISWQEVHQSEAVKQEAEYERIFDNKGSEFTHGFVKKWNWDLARIIAKITHTKYYLAGGKYMYFFGVEENAQIAAALYTEWVVTIDAAAKHALKKYRSWLVSKFYTGQKNFYTQLPEEYQTKYYRESWIEGCLAGISERVRQEESQSSVLVLYDAEVEKKFRQRNPRLKHVKTHGPSGYSSMGIQHGVEYGRNVNLKAKKLGK